MSGSMYLSGHPGEPMKAYVPWVDFGTATNAALATVAALLRAPYDRPRATRRSVAPADGAHRLELGARRAARAQARPRRHGEPQPDRRTERRVPHRRRLDPRAGDRPAALRALVQAGRRDGAARRPALRERPRARRERRAALRADGPLVRGAQLGRGARRARGRGHSRGPDLLAAAGARRSARARGADPARARASRVCPSTRRSRTRRSASRRTRRASARARRSSASTPTRSCGALGYAAEAIAALRRDGVV